MKKILLFIFLISGLITNAQTPDFDAAAKAFENDEPAKTLSLLSQLQLKTGPNPRIESLRALAYEQQGDKEKAYNSTLLYLKMAGRDNTGEDNKDMLSLETSLKKALQSEMDQKKKAMEQQWAKQNNQITQPKDEALRSAVADARQTSDAHFNKLITQQELTANDISLIKANIKTEAAQKLDANVLKINSIKFSNILDLGNSTELLLDPLYASAINYLKSDENTRNFIKKEKGFKFKKDADYDTYLANLKNDLRNYLNTPGIYYDQKKSALSSVISDKYMISPLYLTIPCSLSELVPIIGSSQCDVSSFYLVTKDSKITSMTASKTLADPVLAFTNPGIFNINRVDEIKKILDAKYGVVNLKVTKHDDERNYAKYTDYTYQYTIETKTLWYNLYFYFGPYGRQNANQDRDTIYGLTLRTINIILTKKPD